MGPSNSLLQSCARRPNAVLSSRILCGSPHNRYVFTMEEHRTRHIAKLHNGRETSVLGLPLLHSIRHRVPCPTRRGVKVEAGFTLPSLPAANSFSPSAVLSALKEWINPVAVGVLAVLVLAFAWIKKILDTPSRKYNYDNPNVGDEYDAWTKEGVLERYWGEHIHLGYYTAEERKAGYLKKDFKLAKRDFVYQMLKYSGVTDPAKVLDVGCGFGGTSRMLARLFPEAQVEGVTLSPEQVKRGTELAAEAGIPNVSFKVEDALAMGYPDNTFDLVWACESGEHMPDKKKYVEEMTRVLKPGGTLVLATWCQREETPDNPLTETDKNNLQFLYDEWAHPYFISIEAYKRLMEGTGQYESVEIDDWTAETVPSWHHSIWVGVWDPWIVVSKPHIWFKIAREWVCIERMHRAFKRGLMVYGMARAVKKAKVPASASPALVGASS
eukprot:jgi/Botrbrau1/20132/Bobra.0173s0034.1